MAPTSGLQKDEKKAGTKHKKSYNTKKKYKLQQQQLSIKCPICFKDLQDQAVVSTKCGHVFCRTCLQSALAVKPSCPTCRKKVGKTCYHPLYLDGLIGDH